MCRYPVLVQKAGVPDESQGHLRASPALLRGLGISGGDIQTLRFGFRAVPVQVEAAPGLPANGIEVSRSVLSALCLPSDVQLTVYQKGSDEIVLGPLVGLMISASKLDAVLNGKHDSIYCRYAAHARECGGLLLFFAASDGLGQNETIQGYLHVCTDHGPCRWQPICVPIPTIIYDRAFGKDGRQAAAQMREALWPRGSMVVNSPVKITKLLAFGILQPYPELDSHLPYTETLSVEMLETAMHRYDDLYLKPNALYKGKGILRLTRTENGWLLQSREQNGNEMTLLSDSAAVREALDSVLTSEDRYLVQEGLPLAQYLGNRYDFRSLVQKDGRGEWCVTGLVARIAPPGSVITSPRSGGQVAGAEEALRGSFGDDSAGVLVEIHRVSLAIAKRIEQHLGPCAELGLDLGVLQDGTVKLIEVNGIPLRVSLQRLNDPLVSERINRFPIHFSASLDMAESSEPRTEKIDQRVPIVGIMLGPREMQRLDQSDRYRHMAAAAHAAGLKPLFFMAVGVRQHDGLVAGWSLQDGVWVPCESPLPEVIYNRATHPTRAMRTAAKQVLKWLEDRHRVVLLNSANAFSKAAVYEALRFFPETAGLVPETRPFQSLTDLEVMLQRHTSLFVKANYGSHGADVVRVTHRPEGWEVWGCLHGTEIRDLFPDLHTVYAVFSLLIQHEDWVLQQGIPLPEAEGRLFDLRVIVQKDGAGHWATPMVLVRRAKAGKVAANMSQGGEPELPDQFLARWGCDLPGLDHMAATAATAAVKTAMALESQAGMLGEVGVDIGVDLSGRPWVFEANTKPLHPQLPGMQGDELLVLPFCYAAHLVRRARAGRDAGLPGPSLLTP